MKNKVLLVFATLFAVLPVIAQKDVEAILANARGLVRNGDYAGAAAEMNKAIETDPRNTRYLFEQSQYYDLAKDQTSALENIERALKLEPDKEETVMEAVRRLFNPGTPARCQRALDVASTFLVDHPKSDKAYSWLFFTKQCLHDDAGALESINKAVEINPTYALYQSNRANLVSRMGNDKLALDLLKQLIGTFEGKLSEEKDPNAQAQTKRDLGDSYHQLAVVYERTGDRTLAIDALTKGINYLPDPLRRERAQAYSRFGLHKEAVADMDQVIAEKEEMIARFKNAPPEILASTAPLLINRGDIFNAAGEYQKALADYQEALRRDPRNKSMYQRLIDRVTPKIQKSN